MKRCYVPKTFRPAALDIIDAANTIIEEYQRQGYTLTLRQIYYQFVSRDLLENTVQSYKRLGKILNEARLAGLVDWTAIEDRTRNLRSLAHWDDVADIVGACASQFRLDVWNDQPHRVECWIEKEALAGVFERACNKWRVPFFCCRGYASASEMWSASQRLIKYEKSRQAVTILHFGDHDPSGMDMSRDLEARLRLFGALRGGGSSFERLALNMSQIEEYGPPPNPAKESDSRFEDYQRQYGDESWELDALEPSVLAGLVDDGVENVLDHEAWRSSLAEEDGGRDELRAAANRWDNVVEFLGVHGEVE